MMLFIVLFNNNIEGHTSMQLPLVKTKMLLSRTIVFSVFLALLQCSLLFSLSSTTKTSISHEATLRKGGSTSELRIIRPHTQRLNRRSIVVMDRAPGLLGKNDEPYVPNITERPEIADLLASMQGQVDSSSASSLSSSSTSKSESFVPSSTRSPNILKRNIKTLLSLTGLLGILGWSLIQQQHPITGLVRDGLLSFFLIVETIIWLKLWAIVVNMGWMSSTVTRKIIHTLSAPMFMFHWPFFEDYNSITDSNDHSRLIQRIIVSIVPFLQIVKFYFAGRRNQISGNNQMNDARDEVISAVSRSGSNQEALGGPFLYAIGLFGLTAIFFRNSPVAIVAISQMAAGDGLADIIGRKFGKTKWSFSPDKSLIGTFAFLVSGFLCSWSLLCWILGDHLDINAVFWPLAWISVASATVELFSNVIDDNILVPLVSAVLSYLYIPFSPSIN